MARLTTSGFELQSVAAEVNTSTGSPAIDTGTVRSGAASVKVTGASHQNFEYAVAGVLGRTYYARIYINGSVAAPTNSVNLLSFYTAGFTALGSIFWGTDGKLALFDTAFAQIGSSSVALSKNTWYRVELKINVPTSGKGTLEASLDGTVFATSATANVGNTAIGHLFCLDTGGTIGGNLFGDDVAINDDQGSSQKSYPGEGKVVLLKPTSDNARVGWTGGAGGTTNLWDAVNNTPPVGVVVGSATDTSQIKDATSNATDTYDANLAAYTTAVASGGGGMGANDNITLLQAIARGSNSTTTSRTLGVNTQSNPGPGTEGTVGTGTTAGGTDPTGWTTFGNTIVYAPTPTLGTQPVVRIRKGTASTNSAMFDFLGLHVEYVPAAVLPLAASSGVASTSLALSAKTAIPLNASSGVASPTLALSAKTAIPLAASSGKATTSLALSFKVLLPLGASSGSSSATLSLTAPRTERIRVNIAPPLRESWKITTPSGRVFRWAEDEPKAENVPLDVTYSSSMPGGYKDCSITLPRKPEHDYADLERGSTLEVFTCGQKVGEYRVDRVPRASGDQMAVTVQGTGWINHLEDDKSAAEIFIDSDLSGWGEPSTQRRLNLTTGGSTFNVDSTTGFQDTGTTSPGIIFTFTQGIGAPVRGEMWYYGGGVDIGLLHYDFSSLGGAGKDTNFSDIANLTGNDQGSALTDASPDYWQTTTTPGSQVITATDAGRKYAIFNSSYNNVGYIGAFTNNVHGWLNPKVIGRHGLIEQGTWPSIGFLASDIIAYAISKWAPLLKCTTGSTGTIRPTSYVISHLTFKDRGTAGDMLRGADRYELSDYAVWDDKTFYYAPRGTFARQWRARVREAQLQETGPSMDRVWNGILVRYQDVDGTTRIVGPPNSGCATTSTDLQDTDPLNPANELGIRKWDILDMQGVALAADAVRVGKRFLEESKALDGSGQATITGYVMDSGGRIFPHTHMRAGDEISFMDASDSSARRIVNVTHQRSTRSSQIDLDAPPDSLEQLLARLNVGLVRIGLGS